MLLKSPLRVHKKLLVTSVCVILLSAAALVASATQQANMSDFVPHYTAGRLLLHSPHNLYSLPAQAREQALLSPKFMPWAHPAPEALLFAPLTFLPFYKAYAVWAVIGLLMIALLGYLLRERIAAIGSSGVYLVLGCAGLPLLIGFWDGQDHILTLLLLTLGFLNAERERDWRAGLWLGLALIRWQLTVPLLLMFLLARRWRVVLAACSVAAAMVGVSFLIVGRALAQKYADILLFLGTKHDTLSLDKMPTLRGLFSILPISHGTTVLVALEALLLAFCGYLWWSRRMRFHLLFGSTLILLLSIDMHGFLYELGLLALPIMLLLPEDLRGVRPACFAFAGSTLAVALSGAGTYALLPLPLLALWYTAVWRGMKTGDAFAHQTGEAIVGSAA